MICTKCNFNVKNSFHKHYNACTGLGPRRRQETPTSCNYCGLQLSGQKLGAHKVWCSKNPNLEAQRKKLSASYNTVHSVETKAKLSEIAHANGLGGHTSKKSMYFLKASGDVVFLQSSYEIAFATLLDEMGLQWERPNPLLWLDEQGISHRYYPDFQVGSIFFDTKNDYLIKKDAQKIEAVREQNGIQLIVVSKEQLTKEFISTFIVAA